MQVAQIQQDPITTIIGNLADVATDSLSGVIAIGNWCYCTIKQ
jgi:hypothetical protein